MNKAAIVIIGGGLLGASVAYHLTRRGMCDVILLERLDLATAASSQAAGLMFTISSKPAVDRLSRVTFKVIDALEEQLGDHLDFHQVGTVRFAETEKNRSTLEALYSRAQQEGVSAEIVNEAWLSENLPWLTVGSDALSVYFADDGYIDSYRLAAAYARAAKQSGVRIETGVAVKSITFDSERMAEVQTSQGIFQCEKVVVAGGAWSNNLTMPLGIPLPMIPVRSHYWIAAPGHLFDKNQPMTVHADAGAFTRPEVNGMVLGVQEALSPMFDYRILPDDIGTFTITEDGHEWDALIEAEPHISRFFPGLNEARFESYVTGLSTYTPDGHFILGELDERPGLYVAAGCCGSGVMSSGGIGEALAGLIIEGESPHDLMPFRPDRFGIVDPTSTEFQILCAKARARKAK
ncbi:MAG: FAD-binding oxidoreductase [Desulfobacterales bacterium]|nr:FAD-binding oxidoreductase [Desulfobacterales bacterium]MDX2511508.1 FAD-binding oxidoreductase [Desulfobacterales bacterium]